MRRALTATGSGPAVVSTFNPITIELILRWKTMPDEVRQQITIDGFAKQNNIKPNYWKRHIRADGQLSDLANAKISKAEGFEYSRITYKIVTLWVNMSQPERDQIKLNGFATQHKINFDRLSRLVTHNGELKHDGKAMKHQALGLKFKPISAAQLISWNNMPKAKRRETSLNDFAEQHEINPMLLKRYIGADGQLKITGKAKIAKAAGEKFQVITPDHINKWRKMCPEVRKQTTMDKFAEQHNINPKSWSHFVRSNGTLQPSGAILMTRAAGKKYNPITRELINRWQQMNQQERCLATIDGFAEQNTINPRIWHDAVRLNGKPKSNGLKIIGKAEGLEYLPITNMHINRWQQMTSAAGEKITVDEFAQQNNLDPQLWQKHVKVDGGLKTAGEVKIVKAAGQHYHSITEEHITRWAIMTQEERDQTTMDAFAKQHYIDPCRWYKSVTRTGRRRGAGQLIFDQAVGKTYQAIKEEHITRWQGMMQQERDEITPTGFAVKYNLNPLSWGGTVKLNGGLGDAGKDIMKKSAGKHYQDITGDHITDWQRLSPQARNKAAREEFAERHNIDPEKWRKTIKLDGGPQNNGEAIMNKMMGKKYAPITKEHTRRWNNMSQAERVAISLKGFAKQNLLDPMKWNFKVKLDGGSRRGYLATKDKTTGKKRGLDSIASENKATAPRDRDVILLPDDGAAIPSERHVNDNLPVLRDPGDDVTSILAREEGAIDQIRVTKWADLGDILSLIPTIKQQSAIKEDILQQMKAWLKEEGRHAKRFEDLMEVRRPHNGPPRGKTVYAKRKLAQFEVLGPYAGILHMTDDSLRKEMRAFGGGAVTAYLWETRAQGRSVSGFQQGNTLSFINTSQLTQTSAAWKHNNVGAVRVGKNLTFYLALENINAGEELLVSYGENYNPTGLKIKQEHSA